MHNTFPDIDLNSHLLNDDHYWSKENYCSAACAVCESEWDDITAAASSRNWTVLQETVLEIQAQHWKETSLCSNEVPSVGTSWQGADDISFENIFNYAAVTLAVLINWIRLIDQNKSCEIGILFNPFYPGDTV